MIKNSGEKSKLSKTPLWEDILIIISIFSVWPAILRKENIFTKGIMFFAFFLLIWVFIRRLKRFNNMNNEK